MIFATPALTIQDAPANADHHGGLRAGQPQVIIVHATGGTNSLGWLTTDSPLSNPVSVHRLIDKRGQIYKILPDDLIAWTQGYGRIGDRIGPERSKTNLNDVALSIELENLDNGKDDYPIAQLDACAAQLVEWIGLYGFLPILSHAQVDSRKVDPLRLPWPSLWSLVYGRLVDSAAGEPA